jgi:hypothetical protein
MEDINDMNDPQNQEELIFEAALKYATGAERAVYLDVACARDSILRQRLENLLKAHEQTANALDHPPISEAKTIVISTAVMPVTEQPGQTIGRYKLREKIGEGGCGVVYVADQEEPVRRRVAVKIVKLGMDTRQVVARFEAERQVLALMDHPNIAEVEVAAEGKEDELLALNEALDKFARLDPAKAELVKLRYFTGLTIAEAADIPGISEPTAKRHWVFARAWLQAEIMGGR